MYVYIYIYIYILLAYSYRPATGPAAGRAAGRPATRRSTSIIKLTDTLNDHAIICQYILIIYNVVIILYYVLLYDYDQLYNFLAQPTISGLETGNEANTRSTNSLRKLTCVLNLGGPWHEKLTLLVTHFSLPTDTRLRPVHILRVRRPRSFWV